MRTAVGYVSFVTLTAPGLPDHRRYVPGEKWVHDVCGCEKSCPDLAEWNAAAASCWNRLATALRRRYPGMEYTRVTEIQVRGAIHHHIPIATSEPLDVEWLHGAAMAAGYGCVIDVARVTNPAQVAAYVAKYTTKGSRDRKLCKWSREIIDMQTGELTREGCWPTYRAWSSSRNFGPTIAYLRGLAREQAQARAAALKLLPQLVAGIDDPPASLPPADPPPI